MELANGLALLISALPIGYLADMYSISMIIRCGGVLLLLAATLDTFLVIWRGCDEDEAAISEFSRKDKTTWIALILFAECLWGIGAGIVDGPALALYADSIPAGNRSFYYVALYRWHMIATSIGPLISIIVFGIGGDTWDLCTLKDIIFVGMVSLLLTMNFLHWFCSIVFY